MDNTIKNNKPHEEDIQKTNSLNKTEEDKNNIQQEQEEDLVELQPDVLQEKTLIKRILGPKVIILSFLSLIFISRNIYNEFVIKPEQEAKMANVSDATRNARISSTHTFYEDTIEMVNKLYGYIILTVVLSVIYALLVKANNRAAEQKLKRQAAQQQLKRSAQQKEANNAQTALPESISSTKNKDQ